MTAPAHAVRRRHDAGERPFIVIQESTCACPPTCLHCRAEAVPDRDPRELDTAAAKDLLRRVAAFGQPAPLFVISGGVPFRRLGSACSSRPTAAPGGKEHRVRQER
ncbi:hypothetical protein ACFUN7_02790 [Streptomyces sp. NPDC057236]|uniref:hypothetical protein n=1 Tax=Streptomyces sp. NPDC057236 TaxID=3346059 RepID=UPI003643A01D